jgi:hypothetical protein
MDITSDREPQLQIDDAQPFAIGSAHVDWVMESSVLRDLRGVDGCPLELPVGAKVMLYTGPSVVFVGRVQEDQSVLDLLSSEGVGDDGEYVDF